MNKTQTLTDGQRDQVVGEAVRRKLHAALNVRSSRGWRTFKGRLAAENAGEQCLSVVLQEIPEAYADDLPVEAAVVGCAFRFGHKKCMFSAAVRAVGRSPQGVTVDLSWPEQIQQVQRRLFERAPVPEGVVIPVRFWRDHAAAASSAGRRHMRYGQLEDLSAGGMRVQASDLADVQLEASYQCVFAPRAGAPAVVTDAVLRHHVATDNGRVSLGFQFIGLETTAEGRRVIDRLAQTVLHFQRIQSRRPVNDSND